MTDNKLTSRRTRHANRTPQLQVLTEAQLNGLLPLDYMLAVIRDPNATQLRRDKMAIAAAPYCHARLMPDAPTKGKKDQRAEDAETAGMGTPWARDLDFDDRAAAQ